MQRGSLFAFFFAFAAASVAVQAQGLTPQQRRAEVDHLMSRYAGKVPGASLLVVKDGKPVVQRGYGFADLENGIKTTPDTDYRLASLTKQFTATAVLLLKQDGKLHLDDPIGKWLPELPEVTTKITIANLLAHNSGLVNYEGLIPAEQKTQINDKDVLRMIAAQHRLYFPPGSAHRYSNGGYVLLGLIVQRVSGMDLADFMKQRIFTPLGMTNTLLYEHHRGPQVPHRAYGHSFIDGHWTRTDQSITSATRGDGAVYTNIVDMAKWDAALYTNKLLDAQSRQQMFSPHPPIDDPDVLYGFGWRLSGQTQWHSGETMGFRNVIIRWPKQHVTVVILSNRRHPKPYPVALTIGELFLPH